MDEQKQTTKNSSSMKTKQQITVPFLWEIRPGEPNKDWKNPPAKPESIMPVKYIASVPFKWEEKPGTPLRCFTEEESKEHLVVSKEMMVNENSCLPLPPAYFSALFGDDSDDDDGVDDYDYEDDYDWLSELDFEAGMESASLVKEANQLKPIKETISSAIPLLTPIQTHQNNACSDESSSPEEYNISSATYASRNTSLRGADFLQQLFPIQPPKSGFLDNHAHNGTSLEGSSSPEDDNISRNTSLRGADFLQYLFPLLPPKSGFLEKPGNFIKRENIVKLESLEEDKKLDTEFRRKKPLTLEEMIVQRRKMSCRRKATRMNPMNLPKVLHSALMISRS